MFSPPFKRSSGGLAAMAVAGVPLNLHADSACCAHDHDLTPETPVAASVRTRLHQLDGHLHCSVIGTCLGTAELRRLMARHMDVKDSTDLDVHHLAVSLAVQGGDVSKALHKALDQRHAGAVRSFSAAQDEAGLSEAWAQAWAQGDIPGAYWALLTHKAVTADLRQLAFGEVHMLSHLMGSANRHELQRFVALEKENAQLHERLEREQARRQEALQERDRMAEQLRLQGVEAERRLAEVRATVISAPAAEVSDLIGLQTQRRERAERLAEASQQQLLAQEDELEQLQVHVRTLAEELSAAEAELHQLSALADDQPAGAGISQGGGPGAVPLLQARRVLYVGGRPSSTPAIRDFVRREGGEFLHHDGGLESRKGLLASLLPGADMVVFPVDCVDHDSVSQLKRLAERHQVPFVPLRSASLASFAATLRRELGAAGPAGGSRFCVRHG